MTSTRTQNINFWNHFYMKTSYPVRMNGRICALSLELLTIRLYIHVKTDRKDQLRRWHLLVTIPRRMCQVGSYSFKSGVHTWDASVVGVAVGLRNVASLHTSIRSLSDRLFVGSRAPWLCSYSVWCNVQCASVGGILIYSALTSRSVRSVLMTEASLPLKFS